MDNPGGPSLTPTDLALLRSFLNHIPSLMATTNAANAANIPSHNPTILGESIFYFILLIF
jgi:hypothetical protein